MPPPLPIPFPAPRRIPNLTPALLSTHLASPSPTPLLLPDLARDWPARHWSLSPPDSLGRLRAAVGQDKAVEVELGPRGRGYMDGRYQRVMMGFGLFLDAFIHQLIPSSLPRAEQPVGYLAQHDIDISPETSASTPPEPASSSSPSLRTELPTDPLFLAGPRREIWRRTLWIGPRGSWTPFHRDPYIGIYTQLVGKKRFHLLPPSSAGYLAVSAHPPHTNTSTIPISASTVFGLCDADPDQILADVPAERMERYRDSLARAFDVHGACSVDLHAGESVLVPEGWFHSAEGLEVGVGVNAWFRGKERG